MSGASELHATFAAVMKPARAAPLFLVLTFSVLFAVAARAGIVGIPLALVLVSWFSKYSFALFDQVTLGMPEPPVLSYEMINPANEQRPLAMLAIIGVYYGLTRWVRPWVSDSFVEVELFAGVALLPASTALLGVTGSVLQALDPRRIVLLIMRLRSSYLSFLIVSAVMIRFAVWIAKNLQTQSSPLSMLALATVMYLWLALFSALGAALYRNRLVLGLETWHSPEQQQERDSAEVARERDRMLDRVYEQCRIQSWSQAWSLVQAHLDAASDKLTELETIYLRVAQWPHRVLAERVAVELIVGRLSARKNAQALDLYRQRLEINPDFKTALGESIVRLRLLAKESGARDLEQRLA